MVLLLSINRENRELNKFNDSMPLGMMLSMVAHCHDNVIREELDAIGAQKAYGGVLMQIMHHEGAKQSEIAKHMNFSAPTISITVQKLEENGLIVRKADENDQRQFRIFLTDKGKDMTEKIRNTFTKCENVLAKNFTQEELIMIRSLLKKMYKNISEENYNI